MTDVERIATELLAASKREISSADVAAYCDRVLNGYLGDISGSLQNFIDNDAIPALETLEAEKYNLRSRNTDLACLYLADAIARHRRGDTDEWIGYVKNLSDAIVAFHKRLLFVNS